MTEREFAALRVLIKNSYVVGGNDVELRKMGAQPTFKNADDYADHSISVFKSMAPVLGLPLDKSV